MKGFSCFFEDCTYNFTFSQSKKFKLLLVRLYLLYWLSDRAVPDDFTTAS